MSEYINNTEKRLSGGHPNSLGNTVAVAEDVLADNSGQLMNELCQTYNSSDEVVRLRVSSALKRVAGLHPESMSGQNSPQPAWIVERFDWLIDEIGWQLDQPSAKWSIAQILAQIDDRLTTKQRARGIELMKHNLKTEDDWIVQNMTAQALTDLSLKHNDKNLQAWLKPQLKKTLNDNRRSVAGKAKKCLAKL